MPIAVQVKTARVISVHDQPDTLRLELPSLTPGTYFIPGINAPDSEFAKCMISFQKGEPVQYAQKRELNGKKYVEVEVFEAKTPQYSTEFDMKQDEDGRKMEPPLRRALLTVPAEHVANELERQSRYFDQNIGVRALNHDVTTEDLRAAEEDNIKYLRELVAVTSKFLKFGAGNATEQSKAAAWKLHKLGLLNPLPDWAPVNPQGGSSIDTFLCEGCGKVLPVTAIQCKECKAIYNWKKAVDLGIIPPRDVPPSRRWEAGLDRPKSEMIKEVQQKVAADFANPGE
jgi:hypothetical protein